MPWPGVGRLYLDSLNYQDYSVILGLLLVTSVMVILGSLLADVLYAVAAREEVLDQKGTLRGLAATVKTFEDKQLSTF